MKDPEKLWKAITTELPEERLAYAVNPDADGATVVRVKEILDEIIRDHMPDSEPLRLGFIFDENGPPWIYRVSGGITPYVLTQIEEEAAENVEDIFDKGLGDYLFEMAYEPEERGFEGRIESKAYWEFTLLKFTPAPCGTCDGSGCLVEEDGDCHTAGPCPQCGPKDGITLRIRTGVDNPDAVQPGQMMAVLANLEEEEP